MDASRPGAAPSRASPGPSARNWHVDRRLAVKNIRTGLIAGAIALIVFALSWVVGLVY